MNVLWPYMALQYFYVVRRTDLSYQLPQAKCYISSQYRLAVLRMNTKW